MMKYKVGDRVKVRKDLKVGKSYGSCRFVKEMQNLCGEITRITEVHEYYGDYCVASSHFHWSDEMFESKDMEVQKMHKSVTIVANENKVTAYCDGKIGVARCHPDDDFDFYVGAKIALERLEEAETPFEWLKKGVKYYVPQVSLTSLHDTYVYDADNFDKMNIERGIVFQTKKEATECAKKMLAAVKQEG